jgi:hypothetical protein
MFCTFFFFSIYVAVHLAVLISCIDNRIRKRAVNVRRAISPSGCNVKYNIHFFIVCVCACANTSHLSKRVRCVERCCRNGVHTTNRTLRRADGMLLRCDIARRCRICYSDTARRVLLRVRSDNPSRNKNKCVIYTAVAR